MALIFNDLICCLVMFSHVKSDLDALADPEKAKILSRFFKTGKGEYAEGDVFIGVTVPLQRKVAKKYSAIPLKEVNKLLSSKIHEHRLTALLILVIQYQKAGNSGRDKIVSFYLRNLRHINNWDLVDLSADKILGAHFLKGDKSVLYSLAKSESTWERRIAIIATFNFIKNSLYQDTVKIAEILVRDKNALIQKAVGWMLREVGKRDMAIEESFLQKHHAHMPRTMLRYAVERFDDDKKTFYMKK